MFAGSHLKWARVCDSGCYSKYSVGKGITCRKKKRPTDMSINLKPVWTTILKPLE